MLHGVFERECTHAHQSQPRHCRSLPLPGSGRRLPRHARQFPAWTEDRVSIRTAHLRAVASKPDGLLLHEGLLLSIFPLHVGMRQYWRDFDSLETWARSVPHQEWWQNFVRDSGGTGFWHETYFLKGGMEAIYDDLPKPAGFMQFAPQKPARGAMFSARKRAGIKGEPRLASPLDEETGEE